jgi:hypothetical protein
MLKAVGADISSLGTYEKLKTFLSSSECRTSWQHGPAHCRLVLEKFRFISSKRDVEEVLVANDDVEDRCLRMKDELEAAHDSFKRELAEPKRALRRLLEEMCTEKGKVRWIGHVRHESWVYIWKKVQDLAPKRPDLCKAAEYKNPESLGAFCMNQSGFWGAFEQYRSVILSN